MMKFLLVACAAYLVGSINLSIVLFRMLGREDPRRHHSKNPGVTNVYRQAGPHWALLVLVLEMAKAAGVAFAAQRWLPDAVQTWAGLALIIGNRLPLFHRFQGGKGVANYLGFTCVFTPIGTGAAVLVYAVVLGVFRIPFVASFCMVAVLATATIFTFDAIALSAAATVSTVVFIIYCHKSNIRQLLDSSSGSST